MPVPVEQACKVGATLGEGPYWSESEGKLWFVDIKEQKIHRFDPGAGRLESWNAPAQPGWIFPTDSGRMVAGLQSGIHMFDPASGSFELLAAPEASEPGNRLNDAVIDRFGAIWFGSMDDGETRATGRVYRFADGKVVATTIAPCAITNGPALSPDGNTLYHVDTLGGSIYACTLGDDGLPISQRRLVTIDPAQGYPDGPSVDSEGCIWIGLFGGWKAHRYAPTGELLDTVSFPVANVTKIAFGGADLRTAYATTAHKGLSAAERAQQPGAGDLFSFRVDVPGLPAPKVALTAS
ncbi:MAG: SMP-30/gluconolactonase/LRE family protein [Pseudomonadota bacterium]|uniref:SMP-30/gluconolactonase/LRE family protein n=1 Tax=Sphingobium sp. GW456-12-10-14-TSB1 TaxID=1987165 RepID=UPI000A391C97|nr:SMP-30/gluconolactonase/LRE family protein [Sphingobium sp. GW456-12-10-14-TSB1]OUC55940.1 gluconolaconase [Sphingobium sp. GW456-12-10-14-TSB1]